LTLDINFEVQQARQDSNLQPPVLEPTPSNAGVAAFGDSQGLSSEPPTMAGPTTKACLPPST
jgi:hypothetical protein